MIDYRWHATVLKDFIHYLQRLSERMERDKRIPIEFADARPSTFIMEAALSFLANRERDDDEKEKANRSVQGQKE